jgi:hypothetical protein
LDLLAEFPCPPQGSGRIRHGKFTVNGFVKHRAKEKILFRAVNKKAGSLWMARGDKKEKGLRVLLLSLRFLW